ncbi:unnamed protein product, partial [Ectocarpus sp. 12 AP-2014]
PLLLDFWTRCCPPGPRWSPCLGPGQSPSGDLASARSSPARSAPGRGTTGRPAAWRRRRRPARRAPWTATRHRWKRRSRRRKTPLFSKGASPASPLPLKPQRCLVSPCPSRQHPSPCTPAAGLPPLPREKPRDHA